MIQSSFPYAEALDVVFYPDHASTIQAMVDVFPEYIWFIQGT